VNIFSDLVLDRLESVDESIVEQIKCFLGIKEAAHTKEYLEIILAVFKLQKSLWECMGVYLNTDTAISMDKAMEECAINIPIKPHEKYSFIYIAHMHGTNKYKIGRTGNISKRLQAFKTGNPLISIICTKKTLNSVAEEKMLHHLFSGSNIGGEWFNFTSEEIVKLISCFGFDYCIEGDN